MFFTFPLRAAAVSFSPVAFPFRALGADSWLPFLLLVLSRGPSFGPVFPLRCSYAILCSFPLPRGFRRIDFALPSRPVRLYRVVLFPCPWVLPRWFVSPPRTPPCVCRAGLPHGAMSGLFCALSAPRRLVLASMHAAVAPAFLPFLIPLLACLLAVYPGGFMPVPVGGRRSPRYVAACL